MKKNNITLCLAVGFFALAVALIVFKISSQSLIAISISSFIYTLAQTFRNSVDLKNEEYKQQLDTFNSIGSLNLNQFQLMMLKRYAPWFFSTKNERRVHRAATIFECIAFAILFVGLTIPIPFLYNEKVSDSDIVTVLSFGFLFLSMWQVEKNAERKTQWEDIQMMAMISQQQTQQNSEDNNN